MGAKTWMVVYSNGDVATIWNKEPKLQDDRNAEILRILFPNKKFNALEDGNLAFTCPGGSNIQIADLGELLIVATQDVAIDNPSKIPARLLTYSKYKYTYVFAMHSVVDWFAFAIWENGKLTRSLSLSPDSGIIEDIGERLAFEAEYWSGKHSAVDSEDEEESYPLPFHPLDFGENVLLQLMGYQYEGIESVNKINPEIVPMYCFQVRRWWKFW